MNVTTRVKATSCLIRSKHFDGHSEIISGAASWRQVTVPVITVLISFAGTCTCIVLLKMDDLDK